VGPRERRACGPRCLLSMRPTRLRPSGASVAISLAPAPSRSACITRLSTLADFRNHDLLLVRRRCHDAIPHLADAILVNSDSLPDSVIVAAWICGHQPQCRSRIRNDI